jgi:hypothetical protein
MNLLDYTFNENILNVIEKMSYNFFAVQQDFNVDCICVNFDTKQANPGCKKCLGTGKKIKIKRLRGACQEPKPPSLPRSGREMVEAKNYYIKPDNLMARDNIIVDGDEIFVVQGVQREKAFHGELVFQKCTTVPKKSDTELFLKNFRWITGGAKP